jgi:hypothetical protein
MAGAFLSPAALAAAARGATAQPAISVASATARLGALLSSPAAETVNLSGLAITGAMVPRPKP